MNLRSILENLLKGKNKDYDLGEMQVSQKKVMIIVGMTVMLLIVIVFLIVISLKSNEKKRSIEESIQASEANSIALEESIAASITESTVAEEIRKISSKKDYERIQKEYDSNMEECNKAIKEYNSFLTDVEEFSIEGLPDVLELVQSTWPSFDEYYQAGADRNCLISLTDEMEKKRDEVESTSKATSLIAYNVAVNDYNTVVDAYLEQVKKVSLDFLAGVHTDQRRKQLMTVWVRDKWNRADAVSRIRYTMNETQELAALYLMAVQLENPSSEWVRERLVRIEDVVQCEAVRDGKDPNGLLSLDGGYTSCTYFTTTTVPPGSVPGQGPVAKGTDGGGAVEVYATLEDAKCRCDYLGQYDGTLLYSGSYAILGTMVIRTSYRLTNEEQIALTNKIMESFTEIYETDLK